MKEEHMELLIAFVLREKRYLKKRETSFTEKMLKDGEEILKRFIKAVQSRKYTDEDLKEAESNENKAKKIVREVQSKVRGLSKKQLLVLVQNYALVYLAIEKKHKEHKILVEAMKADRFYHPRRKVY